MAAQEQTRVELDMQDEIRGGAVALGAATGAMHGSIFGAAAQTQRAVTENVARACAKDYRKTISPCRRTCEQNNNQTSL